MASLIRTNQGRMEAFNPRSLLTDDLKLLIKFVDGKRGFADLQRALKPHICSPEKIQQLVELGLIESTVSAAFSITDPNTTTHSLSYLPTVPAELSAIDTSQLRATHAATQNIDTFDLQESKDIAVSLEAAKDCMAEFVLLYAPQAAYEVLSDIESLNSLEQLQASLIAYISFIGASVSPTQMNQHLQKIRHIVSNSSQPNAITFET